MKYLLLSFCLFAFFATLNKRSDKDPYALKIDKAAVAQVLSKKATTTISCTPDWNTYFLSKEEVLQMGPLPGTGSHKWKISTTKDSAQFYFNQGINLYYGFHIIEALPSFKKAQLFDPNCAMLYWAEALAYGPNINDFGYSASPDALTANKKAKELMNNASEKEKVLIEAMQVRYSDDSSQKREYLNQLYADKMKEAFSKFPTDAEIGTLYADALMVQHPWDLWQHDGNPKPWTPEIESTLEKILKFAPEHPGANHYYIHAVEASPFPEKANASAEKLGRLAPGMSHMVHMPSHIYIRTGQYAKGINVNKNAVARFQKYLTLYPDVANNLPLYEIHNRHMQAACSINQNDYAAAIKDAFDCRKSFDTSFLSMDAPLGDFIQYVYAIPELTMITFKKWNEILKQPLVPERFHYAALLQQFAIGMAYANTGKLEKAKASLSKLGTLINQPDISIVFKPFNAPISGATIANNILIGTIAEKENRSADAKKYYSDAVAAEDAMIYDEPRDWLIPTRHFLGNAYLSSHQYKEAHEVFQQDLKETPNNRIATAGLVASMKK